MSLIGLASKVVLNSKPESTSSPDQKVDDGIVQNLSTSSDGYFQDDLPSEVVDLTSVDIAVITIGCFCVFAGSDDGSRC